MSKKITTTDLTNYINEYYKQYSIYTINNRAIPSLIDGFKTVQRKIIYAALKEAKNDYVKVSSLAGLLPKVSAYHHGTTPAEDAIVKMAQPFNQNICFLEGDGTFGTRLVPKASAARYIFVRLSSEFELIYKDNNILPESLDKDDHPEPLYYLPIIPTVLINGVSGIAIGYSTNILPRSPRKITRACMNYLEGKRTNRIDPFINGYEGQFVHKFGNSYECHGKIEKISMNRYKITEVPYGKIHEKFIEELDKLQENGIIRRYEDNSDSKFDITVYKSTKVDENEFLKKLKLKSNITENINLIDDTNTSVSNNYSNIKIKDYSDILDIVKDFCDFRLLYYGKRITYNINRLNREILEKNERVRFIEEVIKGTIKVHNMTRKELVEYLKNNKYQQDYIENLISIPIYALTTDNLKRYKAEITDKNKELKYWSTVKSKDLYLEDLQNLYNKLKY